MSLEIENCSISSGINDGAEWCDIYPPAKLFKLLDIVGEYELDKFTRTNSNLWIFRKMLKDMFLKAKSHAKIPREYPFSHYINNIDHKTMEYTGEMPAPERCYDIMDYYCDLYFSFKEFEKSKFLEGITVLFDAGKLGEFKYIFPPLIVTNKQIIPLTEMLQASFIGLPYKLFTSLLGADEYLFGGEKVSLFPFEDDIYRHQDWYDMHLKLFISDLEQWKGDVQNT